MDSFGLLDVDALLESVTPTANTTVSPPYELPTEDDLGIKKNRSFGVISIDAEKPKQQSIGEPDTVYIVSDKPGFRAESLYNDLSREYKCKIEYLSDPNVHISDPPMCFVVDVNENIISYYSLQMMEGIKKYTTTRRLPIFLIGEPEDLENVRRNIPFPHNTTICEFQRPIDVKECLKKIKEVLSSAATALPRKSVLIVDDSLVFCKLLERVLEKGDYDTTVCTSVFDAICAIAKMPKLPDIICLDDKMPDCDGSTFAKMIKHNEATANIPLVFFTSNNDPNNIIDLMQLGIDNYLLKSEPPIKLREYLDDKFKKAVYSDKGTKI